MEPQTCILSNYIAKKKGSKNQSAAVVSKKNEFNKMSYFNFMHILFFCSTTIIIVDIHDFENSTFFMVSVTSGDR